MCAQGAYENYAKFYRVCVCVCDVCGRAYVKNARVDVPAVYAGEGWAPSEEGFQMLLALQPAVVGLLSRMKESIACKRNLIVSHFVVVFLTPVQERQRISRFRFRKDAKLALVGRLLLQHAACAGAGQSIVRMRVPYMVDIASTTHSASAAVRYV